MNAFKLGFLSPDLIVCDVDDARASPIELLRQLRHAMPQSKIAVYTGFVRRQWALECRSADVNCLLSKKSTQEQLISGLRGALTDGWYADVRFAAP